MSEVSAKPGLPVTEAATLPPLDTPTVQAVPSDAPANRRQRLSRTDLLLAISLIGDMAVAMASLTLAFFLRFKSGLIPTLFPESLRWPFEAYLPLIGFGILLLLITFEALELYRTRTLLDFQRVTQSIFKGTTFWLVAYLGASLVLRIEPPISRVYVVVGSIVGLVVSLPIMAVSSLLIYWESPGPVLYRQRRVGRNGHEFWMLKLRSMRPDAEENGPEWTQPDDSRTLKIGAVMRRWNLDEVPQFWNVLKGDMSLGPKGRSSSHSSRTRSPITTRVTPANQE